jgi:beta-lactamase class A
MPKLRRRLLRAVFLLAATGLMSSHAALGQKSSRTDKKLTRRLARVVRGFGGRAGIYVYDLHNGKQAAVNADTLFPTASTIKLTILATLFAKIDSGLLSYHQPLLYRASRAYGGSGIMQYFKDSTKTNLSVAITLMISRSDNTAALWCQSLAGGGAGVNGWLASHGFEHTRLNSRTPGREAAFREYGWGQTTPREMATLLMDICTAKVCSPPAGERMYRDLTHSYWDADALSQIPPFVQAASKSGAVDASRSEVVLENAPHGSYVFAVYTKDNKDQSWTPDNEAETLIRKISALLWRYFEPRSKWKPAPGVARYGG